MAIEMIQIHPHSALVVAALAASLGALAFAQGPSSDCNGAQPGSVAELVCQDPALAALDRDLAAAVAAAATAAKGDDATSLAAEQQAWLTGRDACAYAEDPRGCVERAYRVRLAELAIAAGSVPEASRVVYDCGGQQPWQLEATFFDTEPPTVRLVRGDQVTILAQVTAASGARYQGHNLTFWEHHGEATLTIGIDGLEMHCTARAGSAPAP